MARIDKVRESYENITERLFSDKDAFAGKFFKLPSAQSMTIFGSNPNATMVAEYDTWQRFDRQVKRGTSSIAVLNNGGLKHFFDISQTNGSAIPYQWTLDKKTATALIEEIFENDGKRFSSFSGCVNYLGSEMAKENLTSVLNSLNIPEENRAGFEKSFISMTQYLIAARCELGGGFKYNGKPDLAALDMLHSKAEKEKLCEFVQLTGKSVLLSLERSINNIIIQGRSNDNGRNQADMVRPERLVRGGQDVLPRNQDGERQNVQARSGNVRVSGANGAGSDGGRTGSDERGHRAVRGEMAAVYEEEPPRGNTVAGGAAEMGADTPTDRQGGLGVSDAAPQAVREREPAPDNVRGDSRMGEHSRNDNRQGDNGGHSSSVPRVTENTVRVDTYINSITRQAEENNSPAFSVAEISLFADKISELSAALTQKYDGNYAELSFLNYMANLDGAEYNSDLSERENAVKMLSGGGTHFIIDYLKTVYAEAYEGHIIVDEGRSAEQLLSAINSASVSKDKTLEIPDDIDKFYVNREAESVTEVYYNPDSDAGGQLVYNTFTFDELFEALSKDNPLDYLSQVSRQELVDVGSSDFLTKAREFLTDNEDFNSNDELFINKLNALVEPTYSIFQIKEGGELRDYRFADLAELSERGLNVDRENYNRVYRARMKDGETLDDLYTKFNVNRPEDFRGHSLSVSDIICIEQNGKTTAHYVDSVGFEEIPDFLLDRDKQITTSVEAFKAKTAANFSPINGFNDADIEDMVRNYVENALEDGGIDAQIVDLAVVGSRSRNLESDNSDLDVAVEFTSDLKENALFNILHEEPFEIGGVTVDINPIRKEETGTLAAYLENAGKTIFENHGRNNLSDKQEISAVEKDLTAYEKQYIKPEARENSIQFGLLGNGITVYDTSKRDKETNDYPTIAHISNEGNVEYRADKSTLKTEDVRRIEQQAAQQKQEFTESWNKLPIEERYQKILDGANALPKPQWDVFFADKVRLSEEEAVKKYERSIIFHDSNFPEAERSLTAYRVGDFYEFYGEDAHISSDLLGLTETSRQGKPMTGFPQHAFEENRRKFAMQGYYLKIGDEREIDKILNTNSQPEKNNTSKTIDDLRVGDLVRGDGAIWRITGIDGDFSINFENTDKTSNMSEQSIWGHWKEQFTKMGFEIVPPAELTLEQLREINTPRQKPKKAEKAPQIVSEDYGEQLNLFGEPMHEVDVPPKNYISGIDVEQALTDELTRHGSSFVDGKFRIEEYYREHKGNTKDFAKFLAKEYGVGGHSGDGKVWLINYDHKGIALNIRLDNGESTKVSWSWSKVANRVATLIDNHEYITQRDIDERIRRAKYEMAHNDADSKEYKAAVEILDNYGLLPEKEPTVTLMSDENEITANRAERGKDNFSVSQEFIFDNERNLAATKNFALSTGATVHDISQKSLRSGLYGMRVETWESHADEIKDFAATQNAVETHEWGAHQVVTFDHESGADEKTDYRSLSEAVENANGYVKGTRQDTYGELVKYDGAVVLNKDNLKIEHIVGDFDVRSIFSEEVLKANGIDVPDNKEKTNVEEKTAPEQDNTPPLPTEIKAGDSFMYRGNVVTVTDDKGIYPDDIVITREEKMGGLSFAVTENVDALQFAREAKRITPETNERGQTEEQTAQQEQTETTAAPLPSITCEYSESRVFESDKTYSVAEFDALMKQADDDFIAGRKAQIAKYGSENAWRKAMEEARQGDENYYEVAEFAGYDKVSFTVNLPGSASFTERQDIGDGYGGVIDFLRRYSQYAAIIPQLEKARDEQREKQTAQQEQTETTAPEQKNADLERAKKLINDFCGREYDSEGNFTDLKQVSIAYTEDEETALPIQVNADLEEYRLTYLFNNEVVKTEQYGSLSEMNDNALNWLNFDELIHEAIEAKENEIHKEKPAEPTAEITEIKNLAQLKRALTVGTEFEITSYIRDDVVNQRRRVNYADTTAIYSIRPDAPDDAKTTLANNGRGSYLPWEKASDWEFANGVCTAYRKGMEHTEENRLFSIKVRQPVLRREAEKRQNAEISNPLVKELAKTFPADTAEKLYNAFEGAKMANWNDNQAKINRVKRALYDILGNKEQTESAFAVLAAGEAPNTARYEREEIPEQTQDGDMSDKLNKIAQTANKKIDFTITDENLGVGGAKEKFAANIAAIETLKRIESRNLNLAADMFKAYNATPEEQKTLSRYVGWGGLPQAFDPANKQWATEYEQLKKLLTDEEYAAAKGSTLNAHYTTPTVIQAIYKGLQNLGFEGGNILEPAMGVGNFFGCMPEEMRQNSILHGVELDSISGRIARQLYQTADIQVKGFEKTEFSDNYFDAAVGNVPFGSYGVSDKRYNRENFFIHDYFLAKTLDKLAPGGVAALITTKGTMDKENPKVREYLAKRADLIGAIRLPNNAFKANAGTEVTTDILFLQKREKMAVEMPDWCYISNNSDGVPVNSYFLDHPEMVLGTMKQGIEFSLYGNEKETACVPIEGANLAEQLDKAIANLKVNNAIRVHIEQRERQAGVIPATADVRNFTFAEVDGKMYFRENNIMKEVVDKDNKPLKGKKLERLKALNDLRKTFRTILTAQENDCSDAQLQAYQKTLNEQYDAFVKKFGYINDSANIQVFGKDDDYNSLCALEIIDEENKTVNKSDFFTKRTVKYTAEITHVDTPQEAMQVSIDTRGQMDIPFMAQLCGQEPQQVIDVLKADNLIYLNPLKANEDNPLEGWEETSEYLSGNVREKLRTAELYAKDNPDFQRNVAALTSVLPPKLEAGDISARIGVSWVDVEDYQKFIEEYAKARFFGDSMRRTITGEYKIENKNWDTSASAIQIYGTSRMPAKAIFENLLNNRDIVVRDKITDPDGREHYEINKKETDLAQEKARQMKDAFKRWLWETPERRDKYVERYNNLFNCIVGRKFDGSHQTFPGMSPSIALKPHQLDAVMRAKFGGNTLLAHCVGAGKSFEMVAATMEKKRLGLINKACVVVPKHLVGQMANEWLRLYPQAKILTATEKDFDKNHRQKFIGRCCTGDYDAVIMSYEQFEKIPMSMEYRQNFIQREIDTMQSGIDDLSADTRSRANNRSSIKDLEREKKRLEARLKKLIEGGGKTKDTSLTFEQLGFDSLVVDEAHNYKNGLVVSKMNRVSGVQTTPAQKSEDILMKTMFLNENYGEKNIIFATGTPVSNSMTELYIMQRYLRPSLLENAGLQTFDDWASNFGEVVSKAELKPAGNGYRTKKRFAKFNNVPELMQMYKEFADIRTADMLDLPVPEIEGGKPQTIVAKPNDEQKAYMQVLADRSEAIHSGAVDPSVDNMLKITNEARLLGLDARCIMPNAENYPDSKVNLCIDKVMEIYQQTTEQKGVQAIFCDIAVNSDDGKFSVYDYIKEELVRRGIPESEICKAGDAETQKQRNEMYAQLRSGTKRIVLASTSKMGTGANIQTKLAALHNLDIPWKPSDIEQRNGRIIRQGNEFGKVGVYNYVTENTFDAYLMNIIVTKQRFISQLMSGNATARSCEDVDEAVLNYSEMQALASGDERIKEKIELDGDVARLRLLESEHYNSQYRLDDTIKNAEKMIHNYSANIEAAKTDIAFAAEHKLQNDEFKVEIGGKVYTERKAAGEAIQKAAIKAMAEVGGELRKPIGTFCGFQLAIEKIHNGFTVGTGISLRNKLTYTTDMDITGDIGNVTRLENLFNKGLDKKLTELEDRLTRTQTDLQEAQAAKGKPFEHADELAQKSARLEQLNRELEVGQADEVIMNESEDEVQGNENRGSHEQDNPDNNRPTPPKHKR